MPPFWTFLPERQDGSFIDRHSVQKNQNGRMNSVGRLPKIDQPGVAARLEAIRLAVGLDKGVFAQSFGLDPSSYSKVINSTKPLKSEYGFAISERWGVPMDFIYRGDLSRIPEDFRNKIMTHLTARQE